MEEIPNSKTLGHYFLILAGHTVSLFGASVIHFIIIWWITVETESVLYLSLATILMFLPQVIILPFTGVLSDILNRKLVLLITNAFMFLMSFVLIFFFAFGTPEVNLVLLVLILRSIAQAFYQPTFFAIFPSMVSQKHLGRINGFSYFLIYLIQMLAPTSASFLISYYPLENLLWIETLTIGNLFIPLLLLKIPKVEEKNRLTNAYKKDHFIIYYFKQFIEGFKAIIFFPGIIIFFAIMLVLEYLGGIFSSLIIYVIHLIHNGSVLTSSLVFTFTFLGVLIGSNIFVIKKYWNPVIIVFFLSMFLLFLGDLMFILAPYQSFGFIFISRFIQGFSMVFVYSMVLTFIQSNVPKNKLGRVSSFYFIIVSLASFFGRLQLSIFLEIIPEVEILLLITSISGIVSTITLYLVTRIIKLKSKDYMILVKELDK
jgi:DHA3 family macrolide efflux protein-like MFS transporter